MLRPEPTGKEADFYDGNFIYEIDNDGYITYANRPFINFVGYDKQDLIGSHYMDILDPRMPRTLFECMQTSTEHNDTWKGYCKNLKSNGDYYWAVAYVTAKSTNDGYIAMFKPTDKESIDEIEKIYEHVYELEQEGKDTRGLIKNIIIGE